MPEIFPTQYSTLSSKALKDYLAQRYALNVLACRYLLRGVSDTYVIECPNEKYIFKLYRDAHRSLTEIKGEVALLEALTQKGAKVAGVVADAQGQTVQALSAAEGTRHGVLFKFAPGKNVYDLTPNQLTVLGHEMAFIHNITATLTLPFARKAYTLHTTLTQPLEVVKPFFRDFPEGHAALVAEAAYATKTLEELGSDTFGQGYCHYDYLPKNFHFDEHDNITLFDFDFAGWGFLANDLAAFSIHLYFHMVHKKITQEEAASAFHTLVRNYRQYRPLSDNELLAIPALGVMFWLFYLGFQCENFDDWSNTFMGPRYLRERTATIQHYRQCFQSFPLTYST
ncbi:phosphotransferase enzyme family protein [Chryseolinea lacunae]|uniref:Phosphotransferase n=1 Tax=Chryseolinea lacunae TaxID=2801331 RepID=A0ABS1KMY9_9BACT|nr:phosphotransferase [Chryseolinea lacunae]MBL0740047.1 phosphotransferase [Chryseolinea lacunae]